ncbi:response regulator transcription factor [Ideonella sp.]|uniref:response regulator transcription factor n=1 Tax=Ideonella sp. TaxID=1929293 RepID=UPI0035ADA651
MKRVLIIDDQADLRRLVRWSLELLEPAAELHEANGASAGLHMVQQVKPDLVLLDVMMPGPIDGLAVCRQIRADEQLASTKVILISARGQAADVRSGNQAGAHAYIVKPFSPQRLLETVERLLAAPNLSSTEASS